MRRLVALLILTALVAAPASAQADSMAFGAPGTPTFTQHDAPSDLDGADGAGEPTIGIPWNTDSVFYQAFADTFRIRFDEQGAPTWEDVTPPNSITNVDPMLHADPDVGRVWAGGLAGPCSVMAFSDDDGESWTPTGNMCSGAQFDHQSIGSGPYSAAVPTPHPTFEHATYYCAQLALTSCSVSHDGGLTWQPFTEVQPPCGGLHGHIRVSRVTGMAAVPDNSCGGESGFGFSETNGLVWESRTVEGSHTGDAFDPSMQFGRDEGWLWYALSDSKGAFIAMSQDDGVSWQEIGAGMGVEATTWLDVGQFHDPPIVKATFADVQVGDDDRVAYAFLGLEDLDGDGLGDEYPNPNQCDVDQDLMVWHYYVALSYDGGDTWAVHRMTDDPVQVGGIWDGGGGDPCRNLLDFNDMDIDSTGRLYIAFADGCIDACATTPSSESNGYRSEYAALLRQDTGRGLFSEFDVSGPEPTGGDTETAADDEGNQTPGLGLLATLALLGAALVLRRR